MEGKKLSKSLPVFCMVSHWPLHKKSIKTLKLSSMKTFSCESYPQNKLLIRNKIICYILNQINKIFCFILNQRNFKQLLC